jgi:hypothetical protein
MAADRSLATAASVTGRVSASALTPRVTIPVPTRRLTVAELAVIDADGDAEPGDVEHDPISLWY